jgi:hypothetical protein
MLNKFMRLHCMQLYLLDLFNRGSNSQTWVTILAHHVTFLGANLWTTVLSVVILLRIHLLGKNYEQHLALWAY